MPYISDLDEAYPDGDTHAGSVLDDDIRTIKANILDTFPNVTGVVTLDEHYWNRASGITTTVQTQLNNEDTGFTALTDAPYMISGWTNGVTVTGPYGYPAMTGTWGASISTPGTISVVHNMDTLIGITVNDYTVTVTPTSFGADVHPLVSVSRGLDFFSVDLYDAQAEDFYTQAFYFQVVVTP